MCDFVILTSHRCQTPYKGLIRELEALLKGFETFFPKNLQYFITMLDYEFLRKIKCLFMLTLFVHVIFCYVVLTPLLVNIC